MVQKWYIRARRFILEQRAEELRRAIVRYPSSDRYCSRKNELESIDEELKTLIEEE